MGCFLGDAWESEELFEGGGDFAVVGGDDALGHLFEVVGFSFVESGFVDDLFEVVEVCLGEVVDGGVSGKKGWGDGVDDFIGALGGEDGSSEEFEGVSVMEGTGGFAVLLVETFEDL